MSGLSKALGGLPTQSSYEELSIETPLSFGSPSACFFKGLCVTRNEACVLQDLSLPIMFDSGYSKCIRRRILLISDEDTPGHF